MGVGLGGTRAECVEHSGRHSPSGEGEVGDCACLGARSGPLSVEVRAGTSQRGRLGRGPGRRPRTLGFWLPSGSAVQGPKQSLPASPVLSRDACLVTALPQRQALGAPPPPGYPGGSRPALGVGRKRSPKCELTSKISGKRSTETFAEAGRLKNDPAFSQRFGLTRNLERNLTHGIRRPWKWILVM